jgi:TonB-linked SusC/RagA family outer membrane protein
VKTISKMPRSMNAYEMFEFINVGVENEVSSNEASWAYFTPPQIIDYYRNPPDDRYKYIYPNTNWVDALTKDFASNYRFNLNANGGTEFVKYFGSVSYMHEGDILYAPKNARGGYKPEYSYNRFNFRGNLDFKLSRTTDLTLNLSGYTGVRNQSQSGSISDIFSQIDWSEMPIKHADGMYARGWYEENTTNVAAQFWESGISKSNRTQLVTDIKLDQKLDVLTKGLAASARISYDTYVLGGGPNINDGGAQTRLLYKVINPDILDAPPEDSLLYIRYVYPTGTSKFNEFDFQPEPISYSGETVNASSLDRALFYQFSLNYNRSFAKNHISALALMNRRINSSGGSFPGYREDWVGRITYNYNKRYFAEVNAGYNGSEKFSREYRFGLFPSLAAGWMLSNEKFLQYEWLSELKLRASVGKVGNDGGIPRWAFVDNWGITPGQRVTFGRPNRVASPYYRHYEDIIANPFLRWETALKYNYGLDLGLFSNQFRLGFDYFIDYRDDIFINANNRTIPITFGAKPLPANIGKTETKGYELELVYRKAWASGWSIYINESVTRARDIVTKYEDAELLPAYQKTTGFPISQYRTYVREGDILRNWDEVYASTLYTVNNQYKSPGEWNVLDFNSDGQIDIYDIIPFGYPSNRPEYSYNTSVGFGYKDFSFLLQFYGVSNITSLVFHKVPYWGNRAAPVYFLQKPYWTPENPDNAFYSEPRNGMQNKNEGDMSAWDASYLRLKTLEISYTIPLKVAKAMRISGGKLYLNGNNLLYWSDLPIDLEAGNVSRAVEHPMYRHFNLGLNVNF